MNMIINKPRVGAGAVVKSTAALLLLTLASHADTKSDLADIYTKSVNALLFFTSEDIISSGSYTFDSSNNTLDTHFIPFTYQFPSDSSFYNLYANGSVGYSKSRSVGYSKSKGTVLGDSLDITTYAIKAGGGVRLNLAKDLDMMMGASYIYSRVESEFPISVPPNPIIDNILNSSKNHHTYELSSSIEYHPTIDNFQPYVSADIRYFNTKIETEYATNPDTTSLISKLKMGVITPTLATVYGLPMKLEFYTSAVLLAGDLDDTLGFDKFYVAGATLHIETSSIVSWIEEVTLNANIVKGDNFDGFNFGAGLSF